MSNVEREYMSTSPQPYVPLVDFQEPGKKMAEGNNTRGAMYVANPLQPASPPQELLDTASMSPPAYSTHIGENMLNPTGQNVFNQNVRRHKSYSALRGEILTSCSMAQQEAANGFSALQDNMTYETILEGLIFQGEKVVFNHWIDYSHVEFTDETELTVVKPPMLSGRAIITDKRLLMLSAQRVEDISLEMIGSPKSEGSSLTPERINGFYSVSATVSDTTFYKPIPLTAFYSVELLSTAGCKTTTNINAESPCCWGMCHCLFACCKVQACTKTWQRSNPTSSRYNERVLKLGTMLPPWGTRCLMKMHVSPTMSLQVFRDFVSAFQCYAPNLNGIRM